MKRTKIEFNIDTLPSAIREHLRGATIYDSSCSEDARTMFVEGAEHTFLKISPKGTLERDRVMTDFLHRKQLAPKAIAMESDHTYDYLLLEAVSGDDGSEEIHIQQPRQLAQVFGEYLRKLHSLPTDGCPYPNRTNEMLEELIGKGRDISSLHASPYTPKDNTLIHGDYCLPNIIMNNFAFKSFIDVGYGGIGDRHYDLYWGIWTLNYNLKTDEYRSTFLDAYGRNDYDEAGLKYFTELVSLSW